eukprot:CAMPEP_0202688974 /NCGR_PEP_ID=MMETSP1385-20130828/4351_1 /ASSEMBLY_ACC=CAM_ASM_000861 /TAXON_ID=933848 /ORGANISM="Elphidium margaritaceum" /LENGTH=1105 /DNA_ID=CAMNT_0049344047 /DNA_START=34 /DNA_END=3351 /DNA_ORIENTATION=+
MSAEEFEVIPSKEIDVKEMEIDDDVSNAIENNVNSNPKLVASNAQFVASQSVSPHVSQCIENDLHSQQPAQEPQQSSEHSEQKDMDCDDENNIDGIRHAINAVLISNVDDDNMQPIEAPVPIQSEHEQLQSEHDSDMNCEQTASPKNVHIDDNVVIPWPPHHNNNNVEQDGKEAEEAEQEEEEEEMMVAGVEEQNEGIVCAEGCPANNNHNHNHNHHHHVQSQQVIQQMDESEAVIVSTVTTTPNRHKRIYDNPYLNGSNCTPGGDDDAQDAEDRADQTGEDSDDLNSEHDSHDEQQQEDEENAAGDCEFTLGADDADDADDESDEEKEDLRVSSKPKNKNQPAAPPAAVSSEVVDDASNNNIWRLPGNSTSILMALLIACLASIVYRYLYVSVYKSKPETPKLHCPSTLIYAPMDGNEFYVNASHADHPSTTQYEWTVRDLQDYDDLYVDGENTATLLLVKSTAGEIALELSIWSTLDAYTLYEFHKQCSIQIVFYASPYFGIDLGTTYSCIAYQDAVHRETKIIVADPQRAEYCIPTAVYFPPPRDASSSSSSAAAAVIVGEDALKKLASDPLNVLFDVKRIVGRPCSDRTEIDHFRAEHAFNVSCSHDGGDSSSSPLLYVPNLGAYIAPEQALSAVVAHLVDTASKEFGVPYAYIGDVVVSIPALFHNGQRKAIRSACELVGLRVRQLIVEPTAASLAYSYYSSTPADNFKLFLTLDIGGGTMDCSVLRCTGVDCQVLSVVGNSSLGGIDFDAVVRDIMIDKYEREHEWRDIRTSSTLMAKFLKVAESVKKSLSVSTQHQITMTNDALQKKQVVVTRREFEQHPRTQQLLESAIALAKAAMNTDRIQQSNIRMILLIGGTTKIPCIQQRLRREFVAAVDHGDAARLKLVFPADDPQLMVVKGSAIIGASIALQRSGAHHRGGHGHGHSGGSGDEQHILKQIVLEDVIPLSLGFSICLSASNGSPPECGVMDVIVAKNAHYPTYAKTTYCQKEPTSTTAKLALYEGDDYYVRNNYLLSNLSIENIPIRDANVCDSIAVEFIIDRNGIATIQVTINQQQQLQLNQTLSVASKDGALSFDDIQKLKREMIDWFNGREAIQNALRV